MIYFHFFFPNLIKEMCSKNQIGLDNYNLKDYKSSKSQIYQQALKDCSSEVKRTPLSFDSLRTQGPRQPSSRHFASEAAVLLSFCAFLCLKESVPEYVKLTI